MKIEKVLKNSAEVESFLENLWHTSEFKQSFKDGGFIRQVCEDFIASPRLIVSMTDPEVEYSHFFSWFNCLCIRKYDNPYIQDLYYLHEIVHIGSMLYSPDLTYDMWVKKMGDNEDFASIISEALVYYHLPIREKTFDFPIWVDRHLNERVLDLYEGMTLRHLSKINPVDDVEKEISKYNRQNQKWFEIWQGRFHHVEKNLSEFYQTENVENLTNFLEHFSSNGVPFWKEAFLFTEVYKQTKASK